MSKEPRARPIQGDLRSFPITAQSRTAIIKYAEIEPLLAELDLDQGTALALSRSVREAFGIYLGPKLAADRVAGHARSKVLLELIADDCERLIDHLSEIDPDYLSRINKKARHIDRTARYFDFLGLSPELRQLAKAARETNLDIASWPAVAPTRYALDQLVTRLVNAIRSTGIEVKCSIHGGSDRRKRVSGPGGDLLKNLFAVFDPHVSEADLYGAMNRCGILKVKS